MHLKRAVTFGVTINFCFLGLLKLRRRKAQMSDSINCKCLHVFIRLKELPNIRTFSTPPPRAPAHTHFPESYSTQNVKTHRVLLVSYAFASWKLNYVSSLQRHMIQAPKYSYALKKKFIFPRSILH